MCGICGKLYYRSGDRVPPEMLQGMMDAISHRGPDGEGHYVSGRVGLGHRRLAIIDLNRGAQPMCNEDRSVWITFNGEIYNFGELRDQLLRQGHDFASNSDTEVIVHAYEQFGLDFVQRLQGMFAFALWDDKKQQLVLARDRVGIKPLYYCETDNGLSFSSEIKSLLVDPSVSREVDLRAVDRFLTYLYLPGENTLFRRVKKVEPGCFIVVKDGRLTTRQYWDLEFRPSSGTHDFDAACDELDALLRKTVRQHMISDVPVGFLLSGGIDSSALLSCAVAETNKRISTFTVGFADSQVTDERPYARLAAEQFGTEHYEITFSASQFRDFLPKYVWHMEEPVCEPPAIALFYVSKLASEHVKVVLSGEGGDEAFGGYQNYRNLLLLERFKGLAGPITHPVSAVLNTIGRINGLNRVRKYSPLLTTALADYYYSRTSSPFTFFNRHKRNLCDPQLFAATPWEQSRDATDILFSQIHDRDLLSQMLYIDTKTWLPDDLLLKADKITMANSLELRVPLLDHKMLEFAASLPPEFKVKGTQTKRILKQCFRRHLSPAIIDRKKTGFPVPFEEWFRGGLKDYVNDILCSTKAVQRGYFQPAGVRNLLSRFYRGEPLASEVFCLVALELWHTQFADTVSTPVGAG